MQTDGKVVLAGTFLSLANNRVSPFIRLTADGRLDETFKPPAFLSTIAISSLVNENGGKILVGGANLNTGEAVLVRLLSNGSIDPSFQRPSQINRGVIKIIPTGAGGYLVASSSDANRWLARISETGAYDSSFDPGLQPENYSILDMHMQPNGKVILAGSFTKVNNVPANRVIRLNANGSIDNSFSVGTGLGGSGFVTAYSVDVYENKILIAGNFSSYNGVSVPGVVRLNDNGSVDPSFTQSGVIANIFPTGVNVISAQPDGVFLIGLRMRSSVLEYVLTKFSHLGTLDTNFGEVRMPMDPLQTELGSIFFGVFDSKFLVTAGFRNVSGVKRRGIALLDAGGVPIQSFNPDLGGPAVVNCIAEQPDGKVLVGGDFSHVNGVETRNFVRLNPNGSVDQTFVSNLGSGFNRRVSAIKLSGNQKILVGGSFDALNGAPVSPLIRLNADGSIDTSFDSNITIVSVGLGVNAILTQNDGKIVAAGIFGHRTSGTISYLSRLLPNGALDQVVQLGDMPSFGFVNSVVVRENGDMLVAGYGFSPESGYLKLITPNGAAARDLWQENSLTNQIRPFAIELLPGGKILVGGAFITSFSVLDPNPVFQFDSQYKLVDRQSLAVYNGEIRGIKNIGSRIFLFGDYFRFNQVQAGAFSSFTADGIPNQNFDYQIASNPAFARTTVLAIAPASAAKNIYIGGNFHSVLGISVDGLAKINLEAPFPPSQLSALLDDENAGVILKWQDKSPFETGFRIFRNEGAGFKLIGTVGPNLETFTDGSAEPLKTYTYRVVCISNDLESAPSNEVTVSTQNWTRPNKPSSFTGTFTSGFVSIQLAWKDESENENHFMLERATGNGAFQQLAKLERNSNSFIDPITYDTRIRYRLRASNIFGDSEWVEMADLPIVTGTIEFEENHVHLYPNPTAGLMWLENKTNGVISVDIIQLSGSKVKTIRSSELLVPIDLSDYSDGLFLIKVTSSKDTFLLKAIKNR